MRYQLVVEMEGSRFVERVNELMEDGWTPHGSVCMVKKGYELLFAQAMVK